MNWKKEIRLSDLVPKRKRKADDEFDVSGPHADEETHAPEDEPGRAKGRRWLRRKADKPKKVKAEKPKKVKAEKPKKVKAEKPKKVKAEKPKKVKAEKPKKVKRPRSRRAFGRSRPKANEVIGLKIGASQITAARVANNGTRELIQLAREPIPSGLVVGGEVRDPIALGEALADFFAKHGLPRKSVRLGLSNSRIGVRTIEIAGIEDETQLENAIRFQAHETLSVPLDEAVLDWHVVSEEVDEEGASVRKVLLVVAYRDSVDRYLAATDHAKIELTGIDLEAFALLRAVSDPAPVDHPPDVAVVAITIGHERTTLAISDGRACQFTRVLEWGGSDLAAAIARALKITPSEANDLKHLLSFGVGPELQEMDEVRLSQALEAARFELQTVVRELVSSLRFYQAQPGSLAIGDILLSGGMADMPGFARELERELGIAVRVADPLGRVTLAPSVDRPDELGSMTIAVGLGIED